MKYTVSVKRLDGKDVRLKELILQRATISPVFSPDVLKYQVTLPAAVDVLRLRIVPWDVGQKVQVLSFESDADFAATEQTPPPTLAPSPPVESAHLTAQDTTSAGPSTRTTSTAGRLAATTTTSAPAATTTAGVVACFD